ncbi:MAG: type II secretion system F family protein [Candidatus Omnitrophota bacterium]
MGYYAYKARDNAGQLVTGNLEAATEQEVINQLRQMQYTPVKVGPGVAPKATKVTTFKADPVSKKSQPVKIRDMTAFCTNLSSMTDAGIPLLDALNMTSGQSDNPYFTYVIQRITQTVSDGSSFSDALSAYPKVFSNFFINMVRVGEMSGTLDNVLRNLADFLEKQETLKQTIRGMMIYPCMLMIAGITVIMLIITFVLPQFVTIFNKAKVPLPVPTQVLYETGLWVKMYWYVLIIVLVGLFFGIKMFLQTEVGKKIWDTVILKIPVIGPLVQKVLVVRFSHTLGAMIDAGVPLLQGLDITRQVLNNTVFVSIVNEISMSVEKGEGIHAPLVSHVEFPRDVTYMISVGEKSGNIGKILNKISSFYEIKVQLDVKGLMVLIEPTFIVIMGGAIGFILASMILPIFDMVKTIQK